MSPMDNTEMYGLHTMYANKLNRRSPAKGGARKRRARSPETAKRQAKKGAALRGRRNAMIAAASAPVPVAARAPRRITPVRISPPAANPEALMRKIAFLDAELKTARGPRARVLMAERANLGGYTPPARKSRVSSGKPPNAWIKWMYVQKPSGCGHFTTYKKGPRGMAAWRSALRECGSSYRAVKSRKKAAMRARSPSRSAARSRSPDRRVKTKSVSKATGASHIRFPQQYGSKSCGACGSCEKHAGAAYHPNRVLPAFSLIPVAKPHA